MGRHGVYVWLLPSVRRALIGMATDRACSLGRLIEHILMDELDRQGCAIDGDDLDAYRRSCKRDRMYGADDDRRRRIGG